MSIYNSSNPNNNYIHDSLDNMLAAINVLGPNNNSHSFNENKELEMDTREENPLLKNTNSSESNHHSNSTNVLTNVPGEKRKFNAQTTNNSSNSNVNITNNFNKRVKNIKDSELSNNHSNNNSSFSNAFNATYASSKNQTNPQLNNSQPPRLYPNPVQFNQPKSTISAAHPLQHSLAPTQPLYPINQQSLNPISHSITPNNNNSNNVISKTQKAYNSPNTNYLINFTQITYENKEIIHTPVNCTLNAFSKMINDKQWLNGTATFRGDGIEIGMTVKNGLYGNIVGEIKDKVSGYTGELTVHNNYHFVITGKGISEDRWGFIKEGYFQNETFIHGSSRHKGPKLPNPSDLHATRAIGTRVNGKWVGDITCLDPKGQIVKGTIDDAGVITGTVENVKGVEGYTFTGKFRVGSFVGFLEGKSNYSALTPPKKRVSVGNVVDGKWTETLEIRGPSGTFTGEQLSPGHYLGIHKFHGEREGLIETGTFIDVNHALVLQNGKAEYTGPMPPNRTILTGKRVNRNWVGELQLIQPEFIFIGKQLPNGHYEGIKKGLGLLEGVLEKGTFDKSLSPYDIKAQYTNSIPPKAPVTLGDRILGREINQQVLLPDGDVVSVKALSNHPNWFIGKRENPPEGVNYDGSIVNGALQGKWFAVNWENGHTSFFDGQFENGKFQRGIIINSAGEITHKS